MTAFLQAAVLFFHQVAHYKGLISSTIFAKMFFRITFTWNLFIQPSYFGWFPSETLSYKSLFCDHLQNSVLMESFQLGLILFIFHSAFFAIFSFPAMYSLTSDSRQLYISLDSKLRNLGFRYQISKFCPFLSSTLCSISVWQVSISSS